jgi:hypothetical protein
VLAYFGYPRADVHSVIEKIAGAPGLTSPMRWITVPRSRGICRSSSFRTKALDPENRSEAHAARDWLRAVQARCGVDAGSQQAA